MKELLQTIYDLEDLSIEVLIIRLLDLTRQELEMLEHLHMPTLEKSQQDAWKYYHTSLEMAKKQTLFVYHKHKRILKLIVFSKEKTKKAAEILAYYQELLKSPNFAKNSMQDADFEQEVSHIMKNRL